MLTRSVEKAREREPLHSRWDRLPPELEECVGAQSIMATMASCVVFAALEGSARDARVRIDSS